MESQQRNGKDITGDTWRVFRQVQLVSCLSHPLEYLNLVTAKCIIPFVCQLRYFALEST